MNQRRGRISRARELVGRGQYIVGVSLSARAYPASVQTGHLGRGDGAEARGRRFTLRRLHLLGGTRGVLVRAHQRSHGSAAGLLDPPRPRHGLGLLRCHGTASLASVGRAEEDRDGRPRLQRLAPQDRPPRHTRAQSPGMGSNPGTTQVLSMFRRRRPAGGTTDTHAGVRSVAEPR